MPPTVRRPDVHVMGFTSSVCVVRGRGLERRKHPQHVAYHDRHVPLSPETMGEPSSMRHACGVQVGQAGVEPARPPNPRLAL